MPFYHGEIVNLSLKNANALNGFKVINIKKRLLGLVKIYTVEFPDNEIEKTAEYFQKNLSKKLKKEWYITLHNAENAVIVFRTKIFYLSAKGVIPVHGKMLDISSAEEKVNWSEVLNYAKKLGIPDNQCDFLPEDFSGRAY